MRTQSMAGSGQGNKTGMFLCVVGGITSNRVTSGGDGWDRRRCLHWGEKGRAGAFNRNCQQHCGPPLSTPFLLLPKEEDV